MSTAILSVYDKTGLVDFARHLATLGWKILASGGTAKILRSNQIDITEVSEYTGSPEILGGRVKTLHPAIHAGLLARDTSEDAAQLESLGWANIDLAVVNLYPFEQTVAKTSVSEEEIIENIDIGGVALIRAAAKNFHRVTVVCDPQDYPSILTEVESGGTTLGTRRQLAGKAFALTAQYDTAISSYFHPGGLWNLQLYPSQELRYGENPHQAASLFSYAPGVGPLGGKLLHGKELSYNNLLDLDAAWRAALSFDRPAVSIVKHLSPCGIATAETLAEAYTKALASDPVSAFGGVIAVNRILDQVCAEEISNLFVECIIAPAFEPAAFEILSKKKNLRLVENNQMEIQPPFELRSINQGILRQSVDFGDPGPGEWKVVSKRQPTTSEWRDLKFAWKACQYVKSNAIVFARGEATVGIGGGQPNRVDCVRMAVARAAQRSTGAVMASDAFFPFPDSVEVAAQAGITAVIHPGGSIRDAESLAAAEAADMAMITTGVRHFRH